MSQAPARRKRQRRAAGERVTSPAAEAAEGHALMPVTALPTWTHTLSFVRSVWASHVVGEEGGEYVNAQRHPDSIQSTTRRRQESEQDASPPRSARKVPSWIPLPSSVVSTEVAEAKTSCASSSSHSPPSTRITQYDRYDVPGTARVNELVLRHVALPAVSRGAGGQCGQCEDADAVSFFKRASAPPSGPTTSRRSSCSFACSRHTSGEEATPGVFALHRYTYHLVKSLVHPLHNYLQLHHGLHNADEIQVMLMPKTGPIAEADARHRQRDLTKTRMSDKGHTDARRSAREQKRARTEYPEDVHPATRTSARHCYLATNQETLSEEALQTAVTGWGVLGVFQIDGLTLVRGRPGRHAELKLLAYLYDTILRKAPVRGLGEQEKVLIAGERLPCAVCRLVAVSHEGHARLLPSHGHFYMTSAAAEVLEASSTSAGALARSADATAATTISRLLFSPDTCLGQLCSETHRRALR